MSDLQKNYAELRKKYSLPDFNELDKYFDIVSIEANGSILRDMRKKIENRLDEAVGLLHGILQPETSVRDLHECHVFSDKEKGVIFSFYRKLMIHRREASLVYLYSEEEKEAAFINVIFTEWRSIHQQLRGIVEKMRDSWKKPTSIKEELGYLG